MAITVIPVERYLSSPNTNPLDVPRPEGLQDGDVVWLSANKGSSTDISIPSGFTSRHDGHYGSSGSFPFAVMYKVITNASAEPASYQISWGSASGAGYANVTIIRGVDTSNMFAATGDSSTIAPAKPFTIDGVTTTVDNAELVLTTTGITNGTEQTGMVNRSISFPGQETYGNLFTLTIPTAGATPGRSITTSLNPTNVGLYLTALRPDPNHVPPAPTARPWWTAQIVE